MIDKFGADAIRLYLLNSPAVKADDLRFSERGVELVLRQVLIPFWNSFVFLVNLCQDLSIGSRKDASTSARSRYRPLDLVAAAKADRRSERSAWKRMSLQQAVEPLVGFIDQLTNWYIRRSRLAFLGR